MIDDMERRGTDYDDASLSGGQYDDMKDGNEERRFGDDEWDAIRNAAREHFESGFRPPVDLNAEIGERKL